MTWFYKRVFTVWWLGITSIVAVGMIASKIQGQPIPIAVLFIPLIMFGAGYVLFRILVWRNVDQAWDAGDGLVICNRSQKEFVPLSAVRNISWSQWQNPETITLWLYAPTQFGDEITFMLPTRWLKFGRHSIVTELLDRVEKVRRRTAPEGGTI
jgi:hypothetical protein